MSALKRARLPRTPFLFRISDYNFVYISYLIRSCRMSRSSYSVWLLLRVKPMKLLIKQFCPTSRYSLMSRRYTQHSVSSTLTLSPLGVTAPCISTSKTISLWILIFMALDRKSKIKEFGINGSKNSSNLLYFFLCFVNAIFVFCCYSQMV
jgi:hypothetical protein